MSSKLPGKEEDGLEIMRREVTVPLVLGSA